MKIKTITCHDVYNAGASLQAYALSLLVSDDSYDVNSNFSYNHYFQNEFPSNEAFVLEPI